MPTRWAWNLLRLNVRTWVRFSLLELCGPKSSGHSIRLASESWHSKRPRNTAMSVGATCSPEGRRPITCFI